MPLLKYIWGYFKKNLKIFFLIIIANFLTFTLTLILPYLNGYYFDMLIASPSAYNIVRFGLLIALLGVTSTLLTYAFNMYKAKTQTRLIFDMFNDIIFHIQKADYMESSKYNPTYLHQRINKDVNVLWEFFFDKILNSVFQLVTIVIVSAAIFKLSNPLFLLIIIVVPIYIFGYLGLRKPLFEKGLLFKDTQSQFYKSMNEQLEYIKPIKLWGDYEINEQKRKKKFHEYLSHFMGYSRLLYIYNSLESTISIIFKVVALILAGFEIMKGTLTIGSFTIISAYFGIMLQGFKFFFSFGQSYQDANNSYNRIAELLNLNLEIFGDAKIEERIDEIDMKNVSFSYNDGFLIKDLKLKLHEGINLILGPNGTGKTTILYIICGLLHGTETSDISYNKCKIQELDIETLRKKKLAIYLQNQKGMDETVEEMLASHMEFDSDYLRQQIHEKGLSGLYLTNQFNVFDYMKQRLCNLSGGEAQRIYLLPVLLKESDILILDEPTSDLDGESKKQVAEILKRMNHKIIIIVTHELYLFEKEESINRIYL